MTAKHKSKSKTKTPDLAPQEDVKGGGRHHGRGQKTGPNPVLSDDDINMRRHGILP